MLPPSIAAGTSEDAHVRRAGSSNASGGGIGRIREGAAVVSRVTVAMKSRYSPPMYMMSKTLNVMPGVAATTDNGHMTSPTENTPSCLLYTSDAADDLLC